MPDPSSPSAILALLAGAIAAGMLGSLTGLGGGVIVVPLLMLAFGASIKDAVPISLLAVIATSLAASRSFLKAGLVLVRMGVLLEAATVVGALVGALIAGFLNARVLTLIFCAVLFHSALSALKPPTPATASTKGDDLARALGLSSQGPEPFVAANVPLGTLIMVGAGMISALVGVGGGVFKVLAMDRVMRVPFRISTTTSSFMLMVTAGASAGIYLRSGRMNVDMAAPVALGCLIGASIGAAILPKVGVSTLRRIFACVVVIAGLELLRRTFMGGAQEVGNA